ncbi:MULTISPECIES: hypothetical protein [unclassified Archaeoglobus]|jgi:hypothetical protein|uniref:hypothetical protein n=1 Tax=unclassified Archaeoglobus TaxID=2643606 RepID=UPI0025C0E0A5|nr:MULTISPECIES: hypothetical protein [unclassified Archaeoglobus]
MMKAEFLTALNGFVASSAKAQMAADNVIAVANVDTSKISEGVYVIFTWAMKIVGMLLEEINRNPALKERMIETGRLLSDNSSLILGDLIKTGMLSSLLEVANNLGIAPLLGKIIVAMVGM